MQETEPSGAPSESSAGRARQCAACGAALVGPLEPGLSLASTVPEQGPEQDTTVIAHAWVCSRCGLVLWYAREQDLESLAASEDLEEELAPRPGVSYERRTQVLRMLRRVRRM
jgi:hypothetical protein